MFEEAWARSRRTSYAGGEVFAALMDGTAAVHVGDTDRAVRAAAVATQNLDDPVDEVGEPERLVLAGAAALMAGDVDRACDHLEEAAGRSDDVRPNTAAWLALAKAASSRPALPEQPATKGTYFDRIVAHLAAGLSGDRDQLDLAVEVADGTGDLVMQAVARLGKAVGTEAAGDSQAEQLIEEARTRLQVLGLEGSGWFTALRLAAGLR